MSRFYYKAKSSPVDIKSGIVEALTVEEAVQKVLLMGLAPVEVLADEGRVDMARPVDMAATMTPLGSRVPLKVLCDFTRQLFDLVDSGIPILRSLEILERSQANVVLKEIIVELRFSLQSGESLSAAMSKHPQTFPVFYVHMIRSGESSGRLPEVLGRLTAFIEKDLGLRSKIMGSLLYPGIVFAVGVLTFFVLLTFVMPRLSGLFEDFDAALPLPTQIVMGASAFMSRFWWLVLIVAAGLVVMFRRYIKTVEGRRMIDLVILRIPLVKDFIRQTEMTRVARTLGTLLEGGVPITVALEAVVDMSDNCVIKEELFNVARDVRGGSSLTEGLKKTGSFWSESAVSMIAVGEETGKLEKGLFKLTASLERETEETAAVFVTVLGPLALFLVVGTIGLMIVAMLLPLFQMNMLVN